MTLPSLLLLYCQHLSTISVGDTHLWCNYPTLISGCGSHPSGQRVSQSGYFGHKFGSNSTWHFPIYGRHLEGACWRYSLVVQLSHIDKNNENTVQSFQLDGYDFWVVGYGYGQWSQASRNSYNLVDALTRHTAQVYPNSWTTILVSLDNQGMWNLRSAIWERQCLGQQFYLRVWTQTQSLANEYNILQCVVMR